MMQNPNMEDLYQYIFAALEQSFKNRYTTGQVYTFETEEEELEYISKQTELTETMILEYLEKYTGPYEKLTEEEDLLHEKVMNIICYGITEEGQESIEMDQYIEDLTKWLKELLKEYRSK